jgi:hypothetical protein
MPARDLHDTGIVLVRNLHYRGSEGGALLGRQLSPSDALGTTGDLDG